MHMALGDGTTNALVVAGAIAAFAGALALLVGALWLCNLLLPELTWATVRRLRLEDPQNIDRAAVRIASSNRAYMVHIPWGVRIVVSLGGNANGQLELLNDLQAVRRMRREREEQKVVADA